MGLRMIEGKECGTERACAVWFDSTTGLAVGPIFDSVEQAEEFTEFCRRHYPDIWDWDPRSYDPGALARVWHLFLNDNAVRTRP